MDCQHVQQLLPFLDRPSEELDSGEQAAAKRHLANCPACTALARSERLADAAVAVVMRDVPVPADLQQKVLKRLSRQPSRFPWKRSAAAIAALMLIGLSVGWYVRPRPVVSISDIEAIDRMDTLEKDKIEEYFKSQGLTVRLPDTFHYQYIQQADVVEFKGQRVAKLTFCRLDGNPAIATVLILPGSQFRLDAPLQKDIKATRIEVRHVGDFTYVIFSLRGQLENLENQERQ